MMASLKPTFLWRRIWTGIPILGISRVFAVDAGESPARQTTYATIFVNRLNKLLTGATPPHRQNQLERCFVYFRL